MIIRSIFCTTAAKCWKPAPKQHPVLPIGPTPMVESSICVTFFILVWVLFPCHCKQGTLGLVNLGSATTWNVWSRQVEGLFLSILRHFLLSSWMIFISMAVFSRTKVFPCHPGHYGQECSSHYYFTSKIPVLCHMIFSYVLQQPRIMLQVSDLNEHIFIPQCRLCHLFLLS